jgi:hypothetical protein
VNLRWSPSLLPILALAACSGPALRGDVYRGDGLAFRLGDVPTTWRLLRVKDVRVAFRDEPAESTVLVNARCGRDGDDVPLLALTQHLFMTFTERQTLEQKVIAMDGVPKMFDAFVLKKDGCVYDFVAVSAPAKFEPNKQVFEAFVAGFHTLSEEG